MPGSDDGVQWTHVLDEYLPRSHVHKVGAFFCVRAASSRVQPMSDDSVLLMIFLEIIQWTHVLDEYLPRSHVHKVGAFFCVRAASSRVQPMSDDSVLLMIFLEIIK